LSKKIISIQLIKEICFLKKVMKMQRITIALIVINLVLIIFLLAQMRKASAQQQQQNMAPVLRGRALEIVDSLGRVRASITIQPAVEMDGIMYPQSVLLRLIDTKGGPLVKLGAAENGAGLNLADESQGGVQIIARNSGSFLKIKNQDGGEHVVKP
jgi:hypothetical protein